MAELPPGQGFESHGSPKYKCYYCNRGWGSAKDVITHTIQYHEAEPLRVQRQVLHETRGSHVYKSHHFGVTCRQIKTWQDEGHRIQVDSNLNLKVKRIVDDTGHERVANTDNVDLTDNEGHQRVANTDSVDLTDNEGHQRVTVANTDSVDLTDNGENLSDSELEDSTNSISETELYDIMVKVLDIMRDMDRDEDFVSVLKSIVSGKLDTNICLHLLLDIGQYLRSHKSRMRYSEKSLQFWITVQKLFKGKGIRFFRGFTEGEESEDDVFGKNFAVPSDRIIEEKSARFKDIMETPGLCKDVIKEFANVHKGEDIKISIDGKKIAIGFGKKLGDEDLNGNEPQPTLKARQNRLKEEVQLIESLKEITQEMMTDDVEVTSLTRNQRDSLREQLLKVIHIISDRIREMRCLLQKRRLAVEMLMKKVEGPWRESKLAPSISFFQTQVIQTKSIIEKSLSSVDEIGYCVSMLNGAESSYILGLNNVVHLDCKENYICLKNAKSNDLHIDEKVSNSEIIKQRSDAWFEMRKTAQLTGSTMFRGLGFQNKSEMQQHFDTVVKGKAKKVTELQKSNMQHGSDSEIHAVATLVSKILPVYYPSMVFREDGCKVLQVTDCLRIVVSGDGSLVEVDSNKNHNVKVQVEFKCPVPGKKFQTPVYYNIPLYYSTQLLSEAVAYGCPSFINLCWTDESSTYFEGQPDNDTWENVLEIGREIYDHRSPSKPKQIPEKVPQVREKLKDIMENTQFLAEFPSVKGIPCSCNDVESLDESSARGYHNSRTHINEPRAKSLEHFVTTLVKAEDVNREAYDILRRPAKEVIIPAISTLERTKSSEERDHAAITGFYLGGFSLPNTSMRGIIKDTGIACQNENLKLKVVSFDGQFIEIATCDDNGKALTVCKLHKQIWKKTERLKRVEKMKTIMKWALCDVPSIKSVHDLKDTFSIDFVEKRATISLKCGYKEMYTGKDIAAKLKACQKQMEKQPQENTNDDSSTCEEDQILHHLPNHIVEHLDAATLKAIQEVNMQIALLAKQSGGMNLNQENTDDDKDINKNQQDSTNSQGERESTNIQEGINRNPQASEKGRNQRDGDQHEYSSVQEEQDMEQYDQAGGYRDKNMDNTENEITNRSQDYQALLCGLIAADPDENSKWNTVSEGDFKLKLSDADTIAKSFTVNDLLNILRLVDEQTHKKLRNARKPDLVNYVSHKFGDSSRMPETARSLKKIARDVIAKWPSTVINIIYATNIFKDEYIEWESNNAFNERTRIVVGETSYDIPYWYAQPARIEGLDNEVMFIIDPHHIFVNNRSRVCSKGMLGMGIKSTAWIDIAENCKENGTGLTTEHVVELRDKQRNSFAQITFSKKVQEEMERKGFKTEANWCRLIRNFYRAVDESGIAVEERIQSLFEMRSFLLGWFALADFPPPGGFVHGMPVTQFEGLLTNIDRRLQLYSLASKHTYNHRALSTLDSENIFGAFQDYDPKGTGVLRADDIPNALGSAVCLFSTRLNKNRGFKMNTTKRPKVYSDHALDERADVQDTVNGCKDTSELKDGTKEIVINQHQFDTKARRTSNPKRSSGLLNAYGATASGAQGVRVHHRFNQEMVYAHRRSLIKDSQIDNDLDSIRNSLH
ncbi:unnamed protein product [Owenia fusiformis]|uniref:Uncharacterized protein n=1 Tax=Owenia fusiformis TaxID=6347 RepID=A0A8J1TD23_OWEFU|nr:unnamed protein product [Owenia fusiformis]